MGIEVLLDLGKAGSISAEVSWTAGDHIGLRFLEPFDMQSLARATPDIAAPTWVMPDYLVANVPQKGPADEPWSRLSVEELREQLEGFLKR
jgi:hypothetical protein